MYDRLQSAFQKFMRGSHDEAITAMAELEKVMSDRPQFYFDWGFFQAEAKQFPAALRLYAGFCAKELNDMTAAIDHWRRFVQLAPHHVDAAKIRQAMVSQPIR